MDQGAEQIEKMPSSRHRYEDLISRPWVQKAAAVAIAGALECIKSMTKFLMARAPCSCTPSWLVQSRSAVAL